MKKLYLVLAIVFCAGVVYAQEAALSSAVTLSVPTANHIRISNIEILPLSQTMRVTYQWLDANKNQIVTTGSGMRVDNTWSCTNSAGQPVENCTGTGEPYPCCTGAGTGTNCIPANTSFTDIFGFKIRQQDVGTGIGKGLRTLIVAKMKSQITELKNVTISFDD